MKWVDLASSFQEYCKYYKSRWVAAARLSPASLIANLCLLYIVPAPVSGYNLIEQGVISTDQEAASATGGDASPKKVT